MLSSIQEFSVKLINSVSLKHKRYFFNVVDFNEKLIGIIGDRGIGKTTFLLQYLKLNPLPLNKKLYITAEYLNISSINLFELAKEFSKMGGKLLVIDEIHKIENFEINLKLIYDYLDLKVIFSGSSAIKLEHSKADLSRRAILYRLNGLSFREFLEFKLNKKFKNYSLEEILTNHTDIAMYIIKELKPFEFYSEYLHFGYYPFYFDNSQNSFIQKLNETINAVIEVDLAYIFNIEPKFIIKLKQLVTLICESKPYELNITKLAQKIGINRNTLYQYIYYLNRGKIFNILKKETKGDNIFTKPDKIYLANPNLNYAYCQVLDIGTIRENFFFNQIGLNNKVTYPSSGDFLIDNKYTFEIGGKNKRYKQIANIPNSYIVADDIEIGFGNKIPLWLFGFLY